MSEFNVGDRVTFRTFSGTYKQHLGDTECIILLSRPLDDGAPVIIAPLDEVKLVKASSAPSVSSSSKPSSSVRSRSKSKSKSKSSK